MSADLPSPALSAGARGSANAEAELRTACNGSSGLVGVGGVFGVIYADPPWRYNFPGTRSESVKDYPTMSVQDLCAMKVPAAKDSVLYMWAITQSLPEAIQLMSAWGYKYKSSAVWDKGQVATGYWWRGQHELLMVGVRGNVKPPPTHLRRSSVIRCPRGRHSAKPDQVRDWIAEWYPDVPRLEMFSRMKRPGWESFGNQVEHDLFSLGGGGAEHGERNGAQQSGPSSPNVRGQRLAQETPPNA